MDLKELFYLAKSKNILEKYNLPFNFFTFPVKMLNEDICLTQIIRLLSTHDFKYIHDTSDLYDFMIDKKNFEYSPIYHTIHVSSHVKNPYIHCKDPFINLLCFMKSYASHTYKNQGSFKDYFKNVFDVFYNINEFKY
jgi:hypothetical protein